MMISFLFIGALFASCGQQKVDTNLPELPPMPKVTKAKPVNSVPLGSIDEFPEMQLDIPITDGPFQANWESIEKNYPGTPQWLRDAKVGFWVHFGPQS